MKYLFILLALCMVGCYGDDNDFEYTYSYGQVVSFTKSSSYRGIKTCIRKGHIVSMSNYNYEAYLVNTREFETNKYCPTVMWVRVKDIYKADIGVVVRENPVKPEPVVPESAYDPLPPQLSTNCAMCVVSHLSCLEQVVLGITEEGSDVGFPQSKIEICKVLINECKRTFKCQ